MQGWVCWCVPLQAQTVPDKELKVTQTWQKTVISQSWSAAYFSENMLPNFISDVNEHAKDAESVGGE